MTRLDLAFFLCCCRACLGSNNSVNSEENFYNILGIEPDATLDEIKRAYKRKSLQMHPDKLAQKGQQVTIADQAKFTRMKEAYEVWHYILIVSFSILSNFTRYVMSVCCRLYISISLKQYFSLLLILMS